MFGDPFRAFSQNGDKMGDMLLVDANKDLKLDDKIAFALHKMNVGGYRHIPILFQGKLVGVISIRDILRYLSERIAAGGRM